MINKTTIPILCFAMIAVILASGCQKVDKTAEFTNRRKAAVKNDQPKTSQTAQAKVQEDDKQEDEKQESVTDMTEQLVEDLKAKQEAEEAETHELDKARIEAEAKELEALIAEIVHDNNEDQESRTAKRVGEHPIWLDKEKREVVVAGRICLRDGPLEMFVTPMGEKSHETVVTVNAWSSEIHMCLALVGALPGSPVEFAPIYTPAHGPTIDIEVVWKDGDKIVRRKAQEMIRNAETKEAMKTHWVFAGSQAIQGEGYYGDGGPLVCLSNFTVATMDIPIKSEASDHLLLYEAFTENVPEVNTQVFVYFKPRIDDDEVADEEDIIKEVQRVDSSIPKNSK